MPTQDDEECRDRGELIFGIRLSERLLSMPLTPREELLALPLGELHARPAALVRRAAVKRNMSTENAEERQRYESWLKGFRDHYSYTMDAYQEAFEQGEILGRIGCCQQMLKLPLTPREELLALTLVELHARAAALEQQLDALRS